ncbi:response regulator [Rhizobium rosettiformans]|uniref:Response regulator n=2 Tax=Rhizobium rosettiformans TaxID=1368430 RepID=A0A4V4HQM6_9HYPH|nr:response regulator [Rhizobium rosettiformans]MBA4798235.1 response regulator [Hyphomicrobiales bacterium]MBB5277354.1 ActR/RegA family two-component response regulator [Rhizobium rosettiformans]MDR7030450.1 ActR/RegA family two-component response regulator [Rhizobium rosettiformans]MDR7066685.1 ActR/RegA family two-component response regulator [Rhizobium rosettiformans]THV34426.1 response regulator [Rhizobium rosettiformans W3]
MRPGQALAIDTILIVEDDVFISMDAADAVARAGVNVITTESVRDALEILDTEHISGAILDFQVRDGAVTPIVQRLRRNGIPFRIVSGSAIKEIEENGIPQELCASKPADYRQVLVSLMKDVPSSGSHSRH